MMVGRIIMFPYGSELPPLKFNPNPPPPINGRKLIIRNKLLDKLGYIFLRFTKVFDSLLVPL
jgi:hypothetical protein